MAKKDHDNIDNFFDHGLDIDHRTLYVGSAAYSEGDAESGVDFLMAEKVIKGLHLCETLAPGGDKPINIYMNNPGGDVVHGMAIYDAIKACKNHVTIIVYGNVCSMAGYILQAADERILAPNSVFMFHKGYDGYATNHPEIIDRWRDFFRNTYDKRLDAILLTAINNKRTKVGKEQMKEKEFAKHNMFDTIMTADKAIEWGFADKLLF